MTTMVEQEMAAQDAMPQQDVDTPTGSHELGFEALRLLAQLARADGVVDAREREVLLQFARAVGLSPSSADATCAAVLRRAHLVLVADGVFDERERTRARPGAKRSEVDNNAIQLASLRVVADHRYVGRGPWAWRFLDEMPPRTPPDAHAMRTSQRRRT